jgi:exodeoxyribonuclease VII large subunit
LITSKQSAAYVDFIKILKARWQGLEIELIDVQVQGEIAPAQITAALEQFNEEAEPPEVLVMIRGGGSPEDLAAFSTEQVTRAVAASRVPTLVAIGHEIDTSLAELAADMRASTPSNAAELLVPDRGQVLASLPQLTAQLGQSTRHHIRNARRDIQDAADTLSFAMNDLLSARGSALRTQEQLLAALSPQAILRRGYAVVRHDSQPVRDVANLAPGDIVEVQLASGRIRATTEAVTKKEVENDKR